MESIKPYQSNDGYAVDFVVGDKYSHGEYVGKLSGYANNSPISKNLNIEVKEFNDKDIYVEVESTKSPYDPTLPMEMQNWK